MDWRWKTAVWASLSCLIVAQTGSGQSIGVTLGRPTPSGIQQASHISANRPTVIRGVGPLAGTELGNSPWPDTMPVPAEPKRFAPLTQATQIVPPKDKAEIIEIGKPTKVLQERIDVIEEGDPYSWSERPRWFSGRAIGGNQQIYATAEWLQWTTRGMNTPPLVTTASPTDPEGTRAALGFGSTRIRFGPGNVLGGLNPGARFTVGYNFDPCGLCAIEGSFFFLGRKKDHAYFDSNTNPVIGRPFFNINTGVQDRELTTSPGTQPGDVFSGAGTLKIDMSTSLLGAEVNHRRLIWCGHGFQVTGLVGFRYLDLSDHLGIREDVAVLRAIPGVAFANDQILVFDRFDTQNRFFGGQIGAQAEWRNGRWVFEGKAKFAIGSTFQSVNIDGGQRIASANGNVQNFRGGLYALPSNIGHHSQSRFGFAPEFGMKVGFQVTDSMRVFAGYDLLYWSSVLRAGDQIDQALDANQVPNSGAPFPAATQRRPIVPYRATSYFAHGLIAGVDFRY